MLFFFFYYIVIVFHFYFPSRLNMNSPPKATGKNQTKAKRYKKRSGSIARKVKGRTKDLTRPKAAPNVGISTGKESDSCSHKRVRDDDDAEMIGGACEKKDVNAES